MIKIYKLNNQIWDLASEHSQQIDAEAQLQRFVDSGIPAEQLKIVSDDSDPNAPQ